jgi:hypothetical protein
MLIARKPMPASADLLDLLEYDEAEGTLRWKPRGNLQWDRRNAGKIAGRLNGAVQVSIHGERFLAHRVIWKMVHGEEPEAIDHADGNQTNNRLANLRACTMSQNMGNKRKVSAASGLKGVRANGSGWQAGMTINGKRVAFGTFKTKREAAAAYDVEAVKRFGEFAATNAALGLAA